MINEDYCDLDAILIPFADAIFNALQIQAQVIPFADAIFHALQIQAQVFRQVQSKLSQECRKPKRFSKTLPGEDQISHSNIIAPVLWWIVPSDMTTDVNALSLSPIYLAAIVPHILEYYINHFPLVSKVALYSSLRDLTGVPIASSEPIFVHNNSKHGRRTPAYGREATVVGDGNEYYIKIRPSCKFLFYLQEGCIRKRNVLPLGLAQARNSQYLHV